MQSKLWPSRTIAIDGRVGVSEAVLTDTVLEDDRWAALDFVALAERAAVATLQNRGLTPEDFEIAVLACDDTRIQALNADFRDKTSATNVLSWPSAAREAEVDGDVPLPVNVSFAGMAEELGDIAISFDTCAREAQVAEKNMPDHVTHLVVHGVLHLLGYDHIRDKDATLMEAIEVEILGKLGITDPYEE